MQQSQFINQPPILQQPHSNIIKKKETYINNSQQDLNNKYTIKYDNEPKFNKY